jgi:hypothetical protein
LRWDSCSGRRVEWQGYAGIFPGETRLPTPTALLLTALIAVIGAVIGALITYVGLLTSKEAKVSEFRQAWIDALRNDISEVMGLLVTTYEVDSLTNNELLYKANLSISALRARISLRLNMGEDESKDLIAALDHLHEVANDTVPPPGLTDSARLAHPKGKVKPLRDATKVTTKASQILLKKEWNRVKEGEAVYRRTQTYAWIVFVVLLLVAATAILICFCFAMIFPAAISSLS